MKISASPLQSPPVGPSFILLMMKREGKRGEVPVEDELPFNPVRTTEARTVGGGRECPGG